MTNNKKLISLIFLVLFVLIVITIWLVVYSYDNNRITPFPDGTEVGYVYIGGKNTWQAETALRSEISKWKEAENLKIELSYQNHAYRFNVDPTIFKFDVNKSVETAKEKQKMNYENGINIIYVSFADGHEDDVRDLLRDNYDEIKFSSFDIEKIKYEILKNVSFLFKEVYIDIGIAVNETIAKNTPVGNPVELVYNQAEFLQGRLELQGYQTFTVPGNSQFSFNQFLINLYEQKEIPETKIDNVNSIYNKFLSKEELNLIATGVYQTILDTNFINISKEISTKKPTYVVNAGFEAVSEIEYDFTTEQKTDEFNRQYVAITEVGFINKKDLTFYNPNSNPYYISISDGINDQGQAVLVFQLYGTPFINTYTHQYQVDESIVQGEIIWKTNDESKLQNNGGYYDYGYPGHRTIVVRKTEVAYPNEGEPEVYYTRLTEDIYMPKDAIKYVYEDNSN